jgi:hypothetical protein
MRRAIRTHRLGDVVLLVFMIIFYPVVCVVISLIYFPFYGRVNRRMKQDIKMKEECDMIEVPNKYRDFKSEGLWKMPLPEKLHFPKKDFPFVPEEEQIIYVESEYDAFFNSYIRENYEELKAYFEEHFASFCYLPRLRAELGDKKILRYRYPTYKKKDSDDFTYPGFHTGRQGVQLWEHVNLLFTVGRQKSTGVDELRYYGYEVEI